MDNNKILNLLTSIFTIDGEEEIQEDDKPPAANRIEKYIKKLDLNTGYAILDGPFISEKTAVKCSYKYKDILNNHHYYDTNLFIVRNFVLVSNDITYSHRDNIRVKLNVVPENHQIELSVNKKDNGYNFNIVAVDNFFLENKNDVMKIEKLIIQSPWKDCELRGLK